MVRWTYYTKYSQRKMYPVSHYWFLIDVLRLSAAENDTFLVEKEKMIIPLYSVAVQPFFTRKIVMMILWWKNPTFRKKAISNKELGLWAYFLLFYLSFGSSDHPRYIGTIQLTGFPPFFLDFLTISQFDQQFIEEKSNEEFTQLKIVYCITMCGK